MAQNPYESCNDIDDTKARMQSLIKTIIDIKNYLELKDRRVYRAIHKELSKSTIKDNFSKLLSIKYENIAPILGFLSNEDYLNYQKRITKHYCDAIHFLLKQSQKQNQLKRAADASKLRAKALLLDLYNLQLRFEPSVIVPQIKNFAEQLKICITFDSRDQLYKTISSE
jgi:hypothetical protein